MRVAAIQYGNHDCSACIYDGEVQNYFLEERYSGKKHDLHHFEIYKQLLKVKEPIDLLVLCYFGDRTFMYEDGLKYLHIFLKAYKKKHGVIPEVIKDKRHHLAHAAGAYYNSGFDKSLVLVVDGSGSLDKLSFEAESVYLAEGLEFKEIYKNFIKLFPEQMDLPTETARLKKLHPDAKYIKELEKITSSLGWEIVKWLGVGPNRKSKVLVIPTSQIKENFEKPHIKIKVLYTEAPRKPRKKGQHRNSPNHSDLYTDENPKGTIKGLKFATVADAKASVSKIRGSGKSHAHKIQAAVAMEQRAREMGKTSQAAVYRSYINKMKKKTKKKNEEFGAPPGMLPSPSRKTVKKMKRKGHTSVPYGSGYKKVNEMLNYPFYGRNVAQVPGNQKDGEHRYYLPKKYRKKNEAVVIEVTECGCSNIYKVEKVNEKWSKKYKKSINCSNPKGFSQKAHCAGRKKK